MPRLDAGLVAVTAVAALTPLPVVVSVPPQAWLVEAIGGAHVAAVALVGPGDSPATYQPTDAQVSRVLTARVFFRIGVPFEQGPWFRALEAVDSLAVIDQAAGVGRLEISGRPGEATGRVSPVSSHRATVDPHVWLSPRRLIVQARTVAAALVRFDPPRRAAYEEGLATVVAELEALDRELANRLAPWTGRAFIVFHPSWGYFAADYGLRQMAVEVGGREPTDRELTRLQTLARTEGLRTVFVQPQISGRAARALAAALDAELVVLDPLATDVPASLRRVAELLIASFEP